MGMSAASKSSAHWAKNDIVRELGARSVRSLRSQAVPDGPSDGLIHHQSIAAPWAVGGEISETSVASANWRKMASR